MKEKNVNVRLGVFIKEKIHLYASAQSDHISLLFIRKTGLPFPNVWGNFFYL